eukprot:g1758.t1
MVLGIPMLASVVFVFHNEALCALLRSVHSVLNRTPRRLLHEIVLVDDFSNKTSHPWLAERLEQHLEVLPPKVKLVRLPERGGLMTARTRGAEAASGKVVVFLDSHIEATAGWIEPLLDRLARRPKSFVVPQVESIDADSFEYEQSPGFGGGLTVLGFHWRLGQTGVPGRGDGGGPDGTEPQPSPIMAGGLLAAWRSWFFELGAYDPLMRLYGGEEMEIAFRIWQCGGAVEYVPCSKVGHVFRSNKHWQGQVYKVPGEEITRNKLRAAEAWMDEYAAIAKVAMSPLPPGMELGTLEPLLEVRRRLKCKPFKWYMENVYPEMWVPPLGPGARVGAVQSVGVQNACLDTLGDGAGSPIGAYPCHGQHGTQGFLLDADGYLRIAMLDFKVCVGEVSGTCGGANGPEPFDYDGPARPARPAPAAALGAAGARGGSGSSGSSGSSGGGRKGGGGGGTLKQRKSGQCLTAVAEGTDRSPFRTKFGPCIKNDPAQQWRFVE